MDNVNWSEERFNFICGKLRTFLMKHVGFKDADITCLPCSGLIGENLSKPASDQQLTAWYKGPHLIKVIGM